MSNPVENIYQEASPNLAIMESSHKLSSMRPSSQPYEVWAASCQEIYKEMLVGGRTELKRMKHCTFCGKAVRLSSRGDQSLIEHMKSIVCRKAQQRIEGGVYVAYEVRRY
ncbi:hypothetical protein AG1IA_06764 [Rhizoctonia solani AG-1 IA]|uniref:Uncharacterized protein n=1 Tax=Thanatephorus cucumeris (strain AG1-IA) TaxID=983506 RepID=L8WM16_THACA|nr:hypothetical protein AG1IA_06764 [Rhizoctonia solani AG-1 IA]